MPNLNIRNIDASLLRLINIEAAKADVTQRDWVIGILSKSVGVSSIVETEIKPKTEKRTEKKPETKDYLSMSPSEAQRAMREARYGK